jgi:hypothetical protein
MYMWTNGEYICTLDIKIIATEMNKNKASGAEVTTQKKTYDQ